MDQEVFRKVHPSEYLKRFLLNNVRPDGRSPVTSRRMSLTTGSIGTAVGSATLKLGRTMVTSGVHAVLTEPSVASPGQGFLEVYVELLSMASSNYRGGRISDDAVCLTEYVRSFISPHVDLSKLCVESGLLVWRLQLTVYCLDNDGNLEDAVLLAAVAAIRNVMLPTVRIIDEDVESNDDGSSPAAMAIENPEEHSSSIVAVATTERTTSLEIDTFPLPISFVLFDGKVLIDPSAEEENVCDSRITFLFRPSGELRGVLKPGGKNLSEDLYLSCLAQGKERVSMLLSKLNET